MDVVLIVIFGASCLFLWWVLSRSGKPHCGECLQQMPRNAKFCPLCGRERYKDKDNEDQNNKDKDSEGEDWPRESWPNVDKGN